MFSRMSLAVERNASSTLIAILAEVSKNMRLYFRAKACPSAKLTSRLRIRKARSYSVSRSILFPTRIIAILEYAFSFISSSQRTRFSNEVRLVTS